MAIRVRFVMLLAIPQITCLAAPAASVLLACLVMAVGGCPCLSRRYGLQFLGHRSHDAALRSMLDTLCVVWIRRARSGMHRGLVAD